jgi:gluconate 5-dehydrogenase
VKNLFSIEGKIVLVTGSTGGLGFTFARGMAQHGARVILNGRNAEKLESRMRDLEKEGLKASGYVFDVSRADEVKTACKQMEKELGPIDILVNNAGITVRTSLEEFKDEDWENILDVNLKGAYLVAKAIVPSMIKRRCGKIINIGSVQSELGRPGIAPYAASKGGIKMLTKGMAVDWAKYNIQINGIGPGYFKTEMTRALHENPTTHQWLCDRTPSQRWGEMDELLGALLFLASDASSYVNGQMIYVDGGLLASV